MKHVIKTGLVLFLGGILAACDSGEPSDEDAFAEDAYSIDYEDGDYEDEYADEAYYDPHMEFCLRGSKLDIDPNTLTDDDCIFRTEGRTRGDPTDTKITAFIASVSDYAPLEEAGIDSFSIDIKTGTDAPKITPGVYTVSPYTILSTESTSLPDAMVHLSAMNADSVFSAVMSPDVEKLKQSEFASEDSYPPYEILSATLTITHVEDIPADDDAKLRQKMEKEMGMLSGQQYVKGTLTFAVKKFGKAGSDYGPETFTFGSINDWTYFPNLGE